MWKLQSR